MNTVLGITLISDSGAWLLQFGILFAHAMVAVVTGLLISSLATSEAMAVVLMIVVLVPQLAFCNALRPLEGFAKTFGRGLVAEFWTLDALQSLTAEPLQIFAEPARALNIAVLSLFCLIGTTVTMLVIQLKDRHRSSSCSFQPRRRRGPATLPATSREAVLVNDQSKVAVA